MERLSKLRVHLQKLEKELTVETCSAVSTAFDSAKESSSTQKQSGYQNIPVVKPTDELSIDPVAYLSKLSKVYPDLFFIDRGNGNKYLVISDVTMYEDILAFDNVFGTPQVAPNMRVNKTVFQIPEDDLEKHEQNAISGLRKYLLNHNQELADRIGKNIQSYMKNVLGDKGTMDLREFAQAIFWPMTEALFGEKCSQKNSPGLFKSFEAIDSSFGVALKGREVPEVKKGVASAYKLFTEIVKDERNSQAAPSFNCPVVGPLIKYYDQVTDHQSEELSAKFATAAWWGGQGNTLPSTVWSFGNILANPSVTKKCYDEVDKYFAGQPNEKGQFDYSKLLYLTACLKETLRLCTFSIGWRGVRSDTELCSSTGNKYFIPKGTLIGLHFALNHHSEKIYDDPEVFKPERFEPYAGNLNPVINGVKYAWMPFSAGRHKCSGYPLAMVEIPLAMALFFREYDMELLDPLPGFNFKQAFGVIAPDDKPVRVRYTKRVK